MKSNLVIDNLLLGRELRHIIVKQVSSDLLSANIGSDDKKTILALIQKRGPQAKLLVQLARSIRTKNKIDLKIPNHFTFTDACGTGGDHSNTFNVSTISSIVAAAAGSYLAKHGNRSITSKCGSSDLMEALGVNLEADQKALRRSLFACGFIYLHAPQYSKKFQFLQPIRKDLAEQKVKTIFNLLGPLVNPAGAKRQIVGVYNPTLVPIIADALLSLGTTHALVFSGLDHALDELVPHYRTRVYEIKSNRVKKFKISWNSLNLRKPSLCELRGGSAAINKTIAINLLNGRDQSPRRDVILLNTAALLYVSGIVQSLQKGIILARHAIDSGRALRAIQTLAEISYGA